MADVAETRPIPSPTELTRPYWHAAAHGRLVIARCTSCGRYVHPPRPQCISCDADDWVFEAVSGTGTIETFTVVHRTFAPGFADRTPYALAWVLLPEQAGLRIFCNVIETPLDDLAIGLGVEVVFEQLDGFGAIPNFRARRSTRGSTEHEGGIR